MTDPAVLTITIDGTEHKFRPSDVSAVQAGEVRKATGMSFKAILQMAMADPDIDVLAALVWMARRQAGEDVSYEEVAKSITYGTDVTTSEDDDDEDTDSPEA